MSGSAAREHEIGGVRLAFDVDHAHAARAEAGQLGLVAKSRNVDAVVAADLEDRLALAAGELLAVNLDRERGRGLRPLRGLGLEETLDR